MAHNITLHLKNICVLFSFIFLSPHVQKKGVPLAPPFLMFLDLKLMLKNFTLSYIINLENNFFKKFFSWMV